MRGESSDPPEGARSIGELYEALADRFRRAVLATLSDREASMAVSTLASVLTARFESATDDQRVRVALTHAHLPKLAAVDLVTYDREEGTVRLEDGPLLRRPAVDALLNGREERDPAETDAILQALASDRRRAVLEILAGEDGPLTVEELAWRLAARERGKQTTAVGSGAVDRISLDLRHVHLLRLDDADLVGYDPDAGVVAGASDGTLEDLLSVTPGQLPTELART